MVSYMLHFPVPFKICNPEKEGRNSAKKKRLKELPALFNYYIFIDNNKASFCGKLFSIRWTYSGCHKLLTKHRSMLFGMILEFYYRIALSDIIMCLVLFFITNKQEERNDNNFPFLFTFNLALSKNMVYMK